MTHAIPPYTVVSAIYAPVVPPSRILPSSLIPWIGARLTWMSINLPTLSDPHAMSFQLLAGSDGFGIWEERPLHVPLVFARDRDLRDIWVVGGGSASGGGLPKGGAA